MNTDIDLSSVSRAFKAYDVRGKIPTELNNEIVKLIGNAFVQFLGKITHPLVIGYDVRPTSKEFAKFVSEGMVDAGASVIDIGLVGTDMMYFAVAEYGCSGGIMITASHNPSDYNGLKFVREDAKPISGDTGLEDIKDIVLKHKYLHVFKEKRGKISSKNILDDYITHILKFINISKIGPLKVVMNAGNGCAGIVLPSLTQKIKNITAIPLFWEPDGRFPNGIPNPLLPERREDTSRLVKETNADIGVAWDGDFDRCFFYDESGAFIEGYYLVAVFGNFFAKKYPHAKIIHDPRLIWATIEAVTSANGYPIQSKAGHAFIKERMRLEDAEYAGEMSAHHYYKQNFYADNGMIPMLMLLQILSESGMPLSTLVKDWMNKYPVSGELNVNVTNPARVLKLIEQQYKPTTKKIDYTDGISLEYDNWRFNLRMSNTEPVIRLNVETRQDIALMQQKTDELLKKINEYALLQ